MTDLQAVVAMLDRAGLAYLKEIEPHDPDDPYCSSLAGDTLVKVGDITEAQQSGSLRHGYYGFYAEFVFKPDGSLRMIGAWE